MIIRHIKVEAVKEEVQKRHQRDHTSQFNTHFVSNE